MTNQDPALLTSICTEPTVNAIHFVKATMKDDRQRQGESNKAGEGTELNTAQKGRNIHTCNLSGRGQALGSAQAISKCTAHGTDCIHTHSD